MRKFFLFLLIGYALMYVVAQQPSNRQRLRERQANQPTWRDSLWEYRNPTGNEFPILGYHTFEYENLLTEENFRNFREAGFNIAFTYQFDTTFIDTTLKYCNMNNVKVMLQANRKDIRGARTFIAKYSNNLMYPGVVAFHLIDEPSVADMMLAHNYLDTAAKYLNSYKLLDINLYGQLDPNLQDYFFAPNYDCYLKAYDTYFNPQFISYDEYGIWSHEKWNPIKNDFDTTYYLFEGFFESLEKVSSLAKKKNVPFWTFVLSTPHGLYRKTTKGHISFQVFNELAYGSQGLQYYGYGPQTGYYETPGTPSQFRYTPVGPSGEKNPSWYFIRDVNQQVQALAHVFLGMQVQNVWHTGRRHNGKNNVTGRDSIWYINPPFTTKLGDPRVPPLPAKVLHIDSIRGEGFIISHFTNGANNYLMFVNSDFEKPQDIYMTTKANTGIILGEDVITVLPPVPSPKILSPQEPMTPHNYRLGPGSFFVLTW